MRFDKGWTKFLNEKFGKDDEEVDSQEDTDLDEDLDEEDEEEDSSSDIGLEDLDLASDESDGEPDELDDESDLDIDLSDESEDSDEDSSGEILSDVDSDEDVEVENLVDDEEEDSFAEEGIEMEGEDEWEEEDTEAKSSNQKSGGSSGGSDFDSWLEDAGITGEVSDFENFDELPDNDELESDSSNDEFGADARSVFSDRETPGPETVEESSAYGRTVEYDALDIWTADARKNGYLVSLTGGSPRTGDRVFKASYKGNQVVGNFSEEESFGKLDFVISESRDLLRFFREQDDTKTPPTPGAKPKTPAQPKKSNYQYDSEDKVPQNAKWLQIEPSKVGATGADDVAKKVQGAGLQVLFATSAYGKVKVAYPGTTPPEKVSAAMVKLGISEKDPAAGQVGKEQVDPSQQGKPGVTPPGQEGEEGGQEDLSDQVDDDPNYQPQRQDSPEDEPDEDTLHVAVKGTDEVVASLKKAGIKVKSFGNHGDNDYIRVDAQDAAALHQWMTAHGWSDEEAEQSVSGAKQKSSLAPIKNAMKEVLGDEAPEVNSVEDFKSWLSGSHGNGENQVDPENGGKSSNLSKVAADFDSEEEIISSLMKDPEIRKHVGKGKLYFDDGDLVYGDHTIASGILSDDGWDPETPLSDFKDKILKIGKPKDVSKSSPSGEETVGRFRIQTPTQIDGTYGSSAKDLKNPRMIIDVDNDSDEEALKKMHDPKKGVNVRIMKRKNGSKVYVDFKKDPKEVESFKKSLEALS